MLKTLLLKEIREHLLTFRFSAALVTTFVLVVVSVWVLGDDFIARNDDFNRMADSFAIRNREVYVPSQISPVVLRPLSPLSIFAQGEDANLGNAVQIHRWNVPDEADDYLTYNSLLHSMLPFDLLSIFVFAISLFGILLSYDAFSSERERGTLKMMCAYNLKRGVIFSVKFLAGVIVLVIPFALSFISSLLVLQFVQGVSFSSIQWLAIASMLAAGMIYGAVFIALGMTCSALAQRSSNSLALALLLWTLAVILIPSAGNGLAATLKPLYSREEISKFYQETSTEIARKKDDFIESNDLDLSSNGSSNIGGSEPYWFEGQLEWLLDHMKYIAFYEKLYQDRADQVWNLSREHIARKQEQYEVGSLLKVVSPAFQLRKAMSALAYTDYSTHMAFLEQCRRYRRAILNEFENKGLFGKNVHRFFTRYELDQFSPEQIEQRIAERRKRSDEGDEYAWRIESFDRLPDDYVPPFEFSGGNPHFDTALWSGGALALLAIIIFAIGLALSVRYDVR